MKMVLNKQIRYKREEIHTCVHAHKPIPIAETSHLTGLPMVLRSTCVYCALLRALPLSTDRCVNP